MAPQAVSAGSEEVNLCACLFVCWLTDLWCGPPPPPPPPHHHLCSLLLPPPVHRGGSHWPEQAPPQAAVGGQKGETSFLVQAGRE